MLKSNQEELQVRHQLAESGCADRKFKGGS